MFRMKKPLLFLIGWIFIGLSACTPQTYPLQITDISASPEPLVGQVVTVHVEVKSPNDEPDVEIGVDLPIGVKLIDGASVWKGSLLADQPQSLDIQVCVLYEGDWGLYVTTFSKASDGLQSATDSEILHLITTANSGRAVPSWDYHYTPTEGPDLPGTPFPEIPPDGICP